MAEEDRRSRRRFTVSRTVEDAPRYVEDRKERVSPTGLCSAKGRNRGACGMSSLSDERILTSIAEFGATADWVESGGCR